MEIVNLIRKGRKHLLPLLKLIGRKVNLVMGIGETLKTDAQKDLAMTFVFIEQKYHHLPLPIGILFRIFLQQI